MKLVATLAAAAVVAVAPHADKPKRHRIRWRHAGASVYGPGQGPRNADGSPFDPAALTVAHRRLPFGTKVWVCFRRCVKATVKDRGPYVDEEHRKWDLTTGTAAAIGMPVTVAGIRWRFAH